MKKQELIHLHGLIGEISGYCEERGIDLDLENYQALETHPASIQRSKSAHKDAVFALLTDINSTLDKDAGPVEAVSPSDQD